MSHKSDLPHCLLIQKYAGNILEYTKGISKEDFENNSLVYDACILNFINIGEQVKSLSEGFKELHPEIPYRKITGLRNIAAHSYEGLEPIRLYRAIREDVPPLYEQISSILKSHNFD